MRSFMLALLVLLPAYTVLAQEQATQGNAQEIPQEPASRLDKVDALLAKELSLCRKQLEDALRIEIRDTSYLGPATTPLARFNDQMKREMDAKVRSRLEDQAMICYTMAVRSAVKQIAPNVAERIEPQRGISPYPGTYQAPLELRPSYQGLFGDLPSSSVEPAPSDYPALFSQPPLFPSDRVIPIYNPAPSHSVIDDWQFSESQRKLDQRLTDLETQHKRDLFNLDMGYSDQIIPPPRPIYVPPSSTGGELIPPRRGTVGREVEVLGGSGRH
jgi:hypothetical protein